MGKKDSYDKTTVNYTKRTNSRERTTNTLKRNEQKRSTHFPVGLNVNSNVSVLCMIVVVFVVVSLFLNVYSVL